MNFDCPPGCGGCSCHISPPCSHCTEHGISEEDGGAPELCLDELGDPVKPVGAHPPLVPPTETTLDVAELQRKVEVLEHQHEEWACHIELVRQAQKAQADRVFDALATLAADASTVANLVKRLDILEEEILPRPSECDL